MDTPAKISLREKLRERFGESIRIGGESGARFKKKGGTHKSTIGDDKKLQAAIKRMNLTPISVVDEVAMMRDDGKGLLFAYPKVSAQVNANTFVIAGQPEIKKVEEYATTSREFDPVALKKIAAEWEKLQGLNLINQQIKDTDEDDDDEIPALVCDNFESVADKAPDTAQVQEETTS